MGPEYGPLILGSTFLSYRPYTHPYLEGQVYLVSRLMMGISRGTIRDIGVITLLAKFP